jgi:hypothetical protein
MANPKPKRNKKGEFKPGNQAGLRHGGEAAVKAIQHGEPLSGPARQAELAVYEVLETEGRFSLVKRNAARLQAATDLYWSAISRLMESVTARGGDIPADVVIIRLDKFVKRFGWLAGCSQRAWAQVKEEEKDARDAMVTDYEVLLREAADERNESG